MHGKYTNPAKYYAARIRRTALRGLLRPLLRWQPMPDPQPGYSILIGCTAPLAAMLGANLQLLARQDLADLDRIIIVFDRPADQIAYPVERVMRERFASLPLEFHFYPPLRAKLFGALRVPWIYSWASWVQAMNACRTRYALLQRRFRRRLRGSITT